MPLKNLRTDNDFLITSSKKHGASLGFSFVSYKNIYLKFSFSHYCSGTSCAFRAILTEIILLDIKVTKKHPLKYADYASITLTLLNALMHMMKEINYW